MLNKFLKRRKTLFENRKFAGKKALGSLLSALFYLGVVAVVFWWQTRDMLSTEEKAPMMSFTLIDVNGRPYQYQFNNGEKDTLIYFFAPWCTICHLSIENTETVREANSDSLNTIIVALDWKNLQEVDAFLAEHHLNSPVVLGTNQIQQQFKISAFPSYYFIDRNGFVKAKSKGYTTSLGMRAAVEINTKKGD
ncbi:redoxin domain-containing protein [Aliikangiella marina]|uniref:Redoxin domain-containing protein n=1 Tax=Aliikangiella marina TaxID=1712262 RepID=A0A545T327_9GAMM|nr:redoxin family protein [Aliikangiella marina]TQV71623.1 redoxin domain-containing protein [Aliikangiella marina]